MPIFQKIKQSVMQKSRLRKLDHFYSLCDTRSSVLDVGVSNNEHTDSVNLFLRKFRLNPSQYTGLAVQPMDDIRKKNIGKRFIEYSGGIFPFSEKSLTGYFQMQLLNM